MLQLNQVISLYMSSFPIVRDKPPYFRSLYYFLKGGYRPFLLNNSSVLCQITSFTPLRIQRNEYFPCSSTIFPSITIMSHLRPIFRQRYTKFPMYWYNVDLSPKCPIQLVLEVINERGRGMYLGQPHLKSSPLSTQPLYVV